MDQGMKRKAGPSDANRSDKRVKTKKQWHVPRKNEHGTVQAQAIQPGDSGIWATCDKGREGKCIGELRDLFAEYAEELYGDALDHRPDKDDTDDAAGIEKGIQAELEEIRKPATAQLFTPVRIDVQCVVFIKTIAPIEPVSLVQRICEDALSNQQRKRTRFVKRLSPMSLMGRATMEGLEKVAAEVLAPAFHREPFQPKTFAIRPNLRNHSILSRDNIIKQVATLVGPGHKVDLKDYDLLIVVEMYKQICGMSIVSSEFERLKRFNLSEIYDPSPKDAPKGKPNIQPLTSVQTGRT